ncbi:MAG: hypothetical protein GWM98_28615, partial [Nitrospinaceae bacterium]|nr:hypothetical protein [Nitrospinaceae bacterium]NIR57693.1 hypothetical protein [Nitrospinaceae bacterium]NIS88156.1 hypothetical protein [Nitrospinaceae bacterium]NIT85035.1 hypothetical protein [Nitrospinaceae bacterium]NIU47196.1 hypothetical protein [Nitrospinaceae bacterium]
MSDPNFSRHEKSIDPPPDPKKRKLWRNLFLFNLCLTLLLIGLFWLPVKLAQLEKFFNSPSID